MKTDKNPIVYITRDRERAEGKIESKNYSIITSGGDKSTCEILKNSSFPENTQILVFKNNQQIEELAKEKNLRLLNPSATLAETIENKITQVTWLGDLAKLLLPHTIDSVKNIAWEKKPFILQWAHSHTGDGTLLISKESELSELKEKFPDREARVTKYIQGPMFTANAVVSGENILLGNISYQITGTLPFTENPFSTIGNDWTVTHSILTDKHIEEFQTISALVGKKMIESGWKGLFGIDIILDEENDQLFLVEINARQPASTTFESQIQKTFREQGVEGMTIFEAHLASLTNEPITSSLIPINDGAQIIQRVTKNAEKIDPKKLENAGYQVIKYNNTKLNADFLRIQSEKGIMETHNKFNKRGKEILELLYPES